MNAADLHREYGQVTVFVTVMAVAMLLMAGLVIDGGRILTAKRQAESVAGQAARAGAQELDVDQLRVAGHHTLHPDRASAAARSYLAAVDHLGTVTVSDNAVTVTVAIRAPLAILSLAGMGTRTVTGTATARNIRGVDGPEP